MGAAKVKDVLWRDVSKKIQTVVKVYDLDHLAEDLREFVIKSSLARDLDEFFGEFVASLTKRRRGADGGDTVAVWIDGFFGSGKSHIAKVIGHVLENPVVEGDKTAVELFSRHLDDPTLQHAQDIKRHLKQIGDHAWCKTIAFEVRAHVDLSSDSLTEAVQAQFYESVGLARTPWVARFEMWLQTEGLYPEFIAAFEDINDAGPWQDARRTASMYEDETAIALEKVRDWEPGKGGERLQQFQSDSSAIKPAILIEEIATYLDSKAEETGKEPHLIFVIDEMGQFIADEKDRIEELRSLVELAGAEGKGRIWFVCTSQEALDKVVDRTGLQLSNLGKLDARFGIKMALTGEDVLEVVYDRVLRKKEAQVAHLKNLYRNHEGQIATLCQLNIERRLASIDEGTFISAYPFLPHLVPLAQSLFNAVRGYKLSGGERNMIGLAQDAAEVLADDELGRIASLDLAFDVFESELTAGDYLGAPGMQLIREADEQLPDAPCSPSRVLKALWLIQRVEWVPRTPEILAKLLVRSLTEDVAQTRKEVENTLERLRAAGYVGFDETTSQYRFLSEEERGLEEDIIDEIARIGTGPAKRRAETILQDRVLVKSKLNDWHVQLGNHGRVPFTLRLDGVTVAGSGELTVEVWSPLEDVDLGDLRRRNLALGTNGTSIWIVPLDGSGLVPELKRLEALDRVPKSSRWKDDQSEETIRLLKDKEKERSSLEATLATKLEKRIRGGTALYAGDEADLDGSRDLGSMVREFLGIVAEHAFHAHSKADKEFDERNIPKYLTQQGELGALDPALGLFDAQDQLVRRNPLVEEIFDELERRLDEGEPLDGASILDHFEARPYGWPSALVRLTLAAMLRGGAIHLQAQGVAEPIYESSHSETNKIFTGIATFKRTRFIPVEGALDWNEIKKAKDLLTALGESHVGESATELASRARSVGQRMRESINRIRERIKSRDLPIRTDFSTTVQGVEVVVNATDPVGSVRKFLEVVESWTTTRQRIGELEDFFTEGRDEQYRLMASLADKARELITEVEESEVATHLQEFDALRESTEIAAKWPQVAESGQRVAEYFGTVYTSRLDACREEVDSLRERLRDADAYEELDEEGKQRIEAEFFGSSSALSAPYGVDTDSLESLERATTTMPLTALEALQVAAPGYLPRILARCAELAEDDDGDEGGEPPRQTVKLQVAGRLLGRRFTNIDELKEELRAVEASAEEILDSADIVLE